METFSPFGVSIKNLATNDLQALQSVAEGWYIEYKREVPSASSIAKSISAFANTYGGWLFYGIVEKAKDDPVAGAFPGIQKAKLEAALQTIRQSIAQHVVPSPHFETVVLSGPNETLGIEADKAIIAIQVPWGPAAPYVHKDGRIYRRVADGSEPKVENDRFVLDQLWRRADPIKKVYGDWMENDPIVSQAEENQAFFRLLIVADIWGDREINADCNTEDVRQIVSGSKAAFSIPFDTTYRTAKGFVCRQVSDNDPMMLGLTYKFSNDLRSEITIPLNSFRGDLCMAIETLSGYSEGPRFAQHLHKQGFHSPNIIDFNMLLIALIGVVRIHCQFAARAQYFGPFYGMMKLANAWRTIPFIDVTRIVTEYEQHGFPLCLDNDVRLYAGDVPDCFIELRERGTNDEEPYAYLIALSLFGALLSGIGVPSGLEKIEGEPDPSPITEFVDAGLRALEVQRKRNERTKTANNKHK